ncbi:cryptochrome/photolyase family protein [Gloeocapsa sp. PCC 73106]|uniref:cryptochrome/photolyase family protein n=1 Tax=Gloeocapsa sp. PCC 73106 TaxID=102232 RepID=UPI0002AD0389|nr:cryptochrome/photolyase family protein [Gloeocapsa sp. PCC 73106]ELR99277.1 deoxyribodipyrimidine photolyase-related protein [Gloeocapsa sp. PCC 73106]
MTIGVWVLGDQLWSQQSALASCQNSTPVILIESTEPAKQRRYHRQKLVLVWSAMRHFAETLRGEGWDVTYAIADNWEISLETWLNKYQIDELRIMLPNDRTFKTWIESLSLQCKLSWLANNHFLWSQTDFSQWANSRKQLLLEDFYRAGRKRFQVLMDGDKPVGGKWNFDKENRHPPRAKLITPEVLRFVPDSITLAVIEKVKALDFPLYGEIEPFSWAVTRSQVLEVLEHFVMNSLASFGPYQDAMLTGEETLWHSLLSPYLNLGLISPLEVIRRIEKAYLEATLPNNSIEGFVRQVLGWREYMQGVYQWVPENYPLLNWFNHTAQLPEFYWDSNQTEMNCLHQVLTQVEKTGYGHHIQRLMILSNFALIVGVSPQAIEFWFHSAFIDAYDWVMQTNVLGMGQFADGGILASKPYAASANYIHRMSDYCDRCVYNYRKRTGDRACPFNFFYWDFLDRHLEQLKSLGRLNLVLAHLYKLDPQELAAMKSLAENWRSQFLL